MKLNPGDSCSGDDISISITEDGCVGETELPGFTNSGKICSDNVNTACLVMTRNAAGSYTINELP